MTPCDVQLVQASIDRRMAEPRSNVFSQGSRGSTMTSVRPMSWSTVATAALAAALVATTAPAAAVDVVRQGVVQGDPTGRHHIVYQVSSNDPASMQHALSSADNAFKLYRSRGETALIEIVANGGGLHMMRTDTTPVGPMLQYMRSTYPTLILTACGTTKTIMEANEKRTVRLLDGVGLTPAGIVRVVELQEQGYAYVKP